LQEGVRMKISFIFLILFQFQSAHGDFSNDAVQSALDDHKDDQKKYRTHFITFGSSAEQDTRKAELGYDAETFGVIAGIDKDLGRKLRAGFSISYANSELDSRGETSTDLDINTIQLNVYAHKYNNGPWMADALFALGVNYYKSSRTSSAGTNLRVRGENSGEHFIAEIGTSYEKFIKSKSVMTPRLSLRFVRLAQDAYTEDGDPGLNKLIVDNGDLDLLISTLDFNYAYKYFNFMVGISYDLLSDTVKNITYAREGGSYFSIDRKPAKFSVRSGLGMNYVVLKRHKLSLNYNFEARSKYKSHNITFDIRYDI